MNETTTPSHCLIARFLGAFFDELARWGVRDVVVSPGSRSTPLSMTAYELSRRAPERMRVFVDVDERGAAFLALGMAKASGRPTAVVCTSGTAVANYYPAVLEAESSRVPLIVLTGDRPPRLQGLGAPQTCDQLKAYGDHVRAFRQMPLPSADAASIAFARQAAREACIAAGGDASTPMAAQADACAPREPCLAGACLGGPVHLNFPFDEPLKPDFSVEDLFEAGRREEPCGATSANGDAPAGVSRETPIFSLPHVAATRTALAPEDARHLAGLLASRHVLVLAGEGSCATEADAREILAFARAYSLPILADPLSGLRCFDDPLVIDNYDSVIAAGGGVPAELSPQAIVRFGRFPVSKKATQFAAAACAAQIVVDPLETRDFNAATDLFARCEPVDFARSLSSARLDGPRAASREFALAWIAANDEARARIAAVDDVEAGFEGAFVRRLLGLVPKGSCLFAANSMSVRALDTFYLKSPKRLTVLCNRGLNGIDGTVSTAIGAAQSFAQTTLLTGDLTLLHDLNALALQRELRVQRERAAAREGEEAAIPSIVIVLLNNNGGGIFDMLPQKSEDDYFERLFLTPQDVDFAAAAAAFAVPYRSATSVEDFDKAYRDALGTPGISLIEVRLPLLGLKERYAPYWGA